MAIVVVFILTLAISFVAVIGLVIALVYALRTPVPGDMGQYAKMPQEEREQYCPPARWGHYDALEPHPQHWTVSMPNDRLLSAPDPLLIEAK